MPTYSLDTAVSKEIITHLTNMQAVLNEVTVTYQILSKLLEEQDLVLRSPTINSMREDLKQVVYTATESAITIADQVSELSALSTVLTTRISTLETDL